MKSERVAPDGGWGYVVVVASFLNMAVCTSTFFAFSVVFVEMKVTFSSSSSSAVALLGSLLLAFSYGFSVIAGALMDQFGNRPIAICGSLVATLGLFSSAFTTNIYELYLTFGVITGCGISMVISPSMVITQQYFDRYRVTASYIVICGLSVGALSGAPMMRALIDTFSWRGAMILHGGIILHGVLFSCAFRPLPRIKQEHDVKIEEIDSNNRRSLCHWLFFEFFDCSLWLEAKYALFCISCFCLIFGLFTFIHHLVNYALTHGVEKHHAAILPTMTGVGSLTSRVLFSIISNHPKVNRPLQFALTGGLMGVLLNLALLCHTLPAIATIATCFGFCGGVTEALKPSLLTDIVGVSRISNAFGMQTMCVGLGVLLGSPFAGFLLDATGTYVVPFVAIGSVMLTGGVLMMVVVILIRRESAAERMQLQPNVTCVMVICAEDAEEDGEDVYHQQDAECTKPLQNDHSPTESIA